MPQRSVLSPGQLGEAFEESIQQVSFGVRVWDGNDEGGLNEIQAFECMLAIRTGLLAQKLSVFECGSD